MGGEADKYGHYWSPVDPKSISNYRDSAGLPNGNSGTRLAIGVLIDKTGVVANPATALHGNLGGIKEYFVPTPQLQVVIVWDINFANNPF